MIEYVTESPVNKVLKIPSTQRTKIAIGNAKRMTNLYNLPTLKRESLFKVSIRLSNL